MIEIILLLVAGSLSDLENEVSNETDYRTELENYAIEHNMSISTVTGGLYLPTMDITELENAVKKHMQDCKFIPSPEQKGLDNATIKLLSGIDLRSHC